MNDKMLLEFNKKLRVFFKEIVKIAKDIKLIKRSTNSFYNKEIDFILFIVFSTFGIHNGLSLSSLSLKLYDQFGINITKQGIDFKLSEEKTVLFLKMVLDMLLKLDFNFNTGLSPDMFSSFNNILLEDSTIVMLKDELRDNYKGVLSMVSALKVTYLYNANFSYSNISIHDSNQNDQSLSDENLSNFKKNDLIIRDLGYYKLLILRKIMKKGVYFLSRFLYGTKIRFNLDGRTYTINEFLRKKENHGKKIIEANIYLGVKEKLPVRIVAYKIPIATYKKRTYNKEKHLRNSDVISKDYKNALRYTILITNIPEKVIEKEILGILYKFRWQIELVIKENKSLLKLGDISHTKNSNKVKTILYARLIASFLISPIKKYTSEKAVKINKELSPTKLINWLVMDKKLIECFKEQEFTTIFENINKVLKNLLKGKRKRKTMMQQIEEKIKYLNSFKT